MWGHLPCPKGYRGVRELAEQLWAEHAFFAGCQMLQHDSADRNDLELNNEHPLVAEHPVVRVHPETGVKSLFVNPASTSRILGLNPAQSRALLDLFFEQIMRPEFTVCWRWTPGDVVLSDNRSTAHLSADDAGVAREQLTLYRVMILGDTPVGPNGHSSLAIAGEPIAALPDHIGSVTG
ncbi:TauD/TfdA family dioxygenase [Streptomyces cinnamoneus]|uniref:TauD/TfdA dioxygenase family protein n=1 Tax=Streptomyces cinnamoneus TaxID=53446 RepID=UPI00342F8642